MSRNISKRILVVMHELLVPPDSLAGFTDNELADWKTEFDVVQTLKMLGHQVEKLGSSTDLPAIAQKIESFKPHVCFNLLEEFHGVGTYDHAVASFLELMQVPFTGCRARGLMLSHDKFLAKKIFRYHGIPTPNFLVVPKGKKIPKLDGLSFPLIVKSVIEDASLGITENSVVHDLEQLQHQVDLVHKHLLTDALIEEFISGREFYVGALGNQRMQIFPVWELLFKNAPEKQVIATSSVKWDDVTQADLGVETELADLPKAMVKKIESICRKVCEALSLVGYCRIDFRMNEKGEIFVLEANPNPNLSFGEDFAESAEKAGIAYEELIEKIVQLGISYRPAWKQL